jgi:hypothetical protein
MPQQLCFSVGFEHIDFALLDVSSKKIIRKNSVNLIERTEDQNKEILKQALSAENLLHFNENVSLSFAGKNSTLIPQNMFGETNPKKVYEFCFSTTQNDIDYNRFPEMGLVNIYEIPSWVKSFFVIRYPSIVLQHETTHLLRGLFKGATFKPIVHLSVESTHFYLIIAQQNKLLFCNAFDFAEMDDILYHLLFVLEQKDILNQDLTLEWIDKGTQEGLFKNFQQAIQKIAHKIQLIQSEEKSFKNQLLCV